MNDPAESESQRRIVVDIAAQTLYLLDTSHAERRLLSTYSVSTSGKGCGQRRDSEMTPLGEHVVRAKIGAGLPSGAVLAGRRPTGEIYSTEIARKYPKRDWILSRILWLSGTQIGHNRLGEVDTMRRYIYLHGSPDEARMGIPGSHGCVRMRNQDVIELFDAVPIGTPVEIREKGGWR